MTFIIEVLYQKFYNYKTSTFNDNWYSGALWDSWRPINDINCNRNIKYSTDKGFRQIMIFLVARNTIVFLSMISFSLRGKMLRELIDLKKLFAKLYHRTNGKQLFKAIYISIIIFSSALIFDSIDWFIGIFSL